MSRNIFTISLLHRVTEESSLPKVQLLFLLIKVLAARHLLCRFARPGRLVKGHGFVARRLVEGPVLKAHVELATVLRVGQPVVVAEPETGFGTGELSDHCCLALWSFGLGRCGTGKDGWTPNNSSAALSWGWVAVHARCVLVALLWLLRMEVAVLPWAAWRGFGLLQFGPVLALDPLRVVARLARNIVHKAILAKSRRQLAVGSALVELVALERVFNRVLANLWRTFQVVNINKVSPRDQFLSEKKALELLKESLILISGKVIREKIDELVSIELSLFWCIPLRYGHCHHYKGQ